mmetsp:Transcript_4636/g.17693  ORF Transcript_4636/g.17693 Transcript_4636/m.17693 type:complete len:271 (+) Transcript_4636:826-1638(+)
MSMRLLRSSSSGICTTTSASSDVSLVAVGATLHGMSPSTSAGARAKSSAASFACNVVGHIACCGILIAMDMTTFTVLPKSSASCISSTARSALVRDMKHTYPLFDVSRLSLLGRQIFTLAIGPYRSNARARSTAATSTGRFVIRTFELREASVAVAGSTRSDVDAGSERADASGTTGALAANSSSIASIALSFFFPRGALGPASTSFSASAPLRFAAGAGPSRAPSAYTSPTPSSSTPSRASGRCNPPRTKVTAFARPSSSSSSPSPNSF